MSEFRHLDLFSGIGGFALAVDQVWPGAEHIFCEIDPFCQAVLRKNFGKEITIYGDIRTLTADAIGSNGGRESDGRVQNKGREAGKGGREGKQPKDRPTRSDNAKSSLVVIANSHNRRPQIVKEQTAGNKQRNRVDLLTGGFPCQPFSQAGKRKGKSDDRWLWPEMLRVIREFQPTWIIGENVSGLVSMAQRQGESALDSAIGDEIKDDEDSTADGVLCEILDALVEVGYAVQAFIIPACGVGAPHRRDRVWIVAHRTSDCTGLERRIQTGKSFNMELRREISWREPWLEVATELCGVDDGLPAELDGLKFSKSKHRVERLKALGNAIVPAVVVEIMQGIRSASEVC